MSKDAFERYAPFLQEYIYRKGWTDLRTVQAEAVEAILDTEDHVIIASGTASGKTEAAFFPILTKLSGEDLHSVGVLYIGPLKALINDQFSRLEELLKEQDIPVWPWHGDISSTVKARARKNARGILQITPEALEAMLIRSPKDAARLFCDLRFVVIDEIHAMMGTDRGLQLLCLLARTERAAGVSPRRIGLSATLHDYEPAMKFLGAGTDRKVRAIGLGTQNRKIALYVESFPGLPENPQEDSVEEKDAKRVGWSMLTELLYRQTLGKKCIIFANSRSETEEIAHRLQRFAQSAQAAGREENLYRIHHGSISAAHRKETEEALKEYNGGVTVAATSTLELGIDIGDLDAVMQVGAPTNCSGFVQRLGRSGRRSGLSRMLFAGVRDSRKADSPECFPWDLLQTIAVIELYRKERWVEPFTEKSKPYSLLAHQTLSTLMEKGALAPSDLARCVLTLPPFADRISLEEYRLLLRNMLEHAYLDRLDNGELLVGLTGESITAYYGFYSVFEDREEYEVRTPDGVIGTLGKAPAVNTVFLLSGRSWKAEEVDQERRVVYAVKAAGNPDSMWSGQGAPLHGGIVQEVQRILRDTDSPAYLGTNAAALLKEARAYSDRAGMIDDQYLAAGPKELYLFPWLGSSGMNALSILLGRIYRKKLGISAVRKEDYYVFVRASESADEVIRGLKMLTVSPEELERIKAPLMKGDTWESDLNIPLETDRYDFMVPEGLLHIAFFENTMDLNAAAEWINGFQAGSGTDGKNEN